MRENYLEEYYSFLRFPSVSTDDKYKQKLQECERWLVEKLTSIGLETKLVPTRGHPIIWARNKHQPGRRTVLIYGHYDVQPPDPLELWDSPPFEPVLKNGYVFARGATDNKGQILSHILGIQETIEQSGDLPVNLHLVIEGEEEIGSANLGGFLNENRDALKSDVAVVSDTGMIEGDKPILKETGVPELFGEAGYNSVERIWARPTAEINGIGGGYQGKGTKTVIASHAMAKLTFRLVPEQEGDEILKLAKEHLRKNLPKGVTMEITTGHSGPWYLTDPHSPLGEAAQRALRKALDRDVALISEGGSISIVSQLP